MDPAWSDNIDHVVTADTSGIWNRQVQLGVLYATIGIAVGGAFWEGGETTLGKTYWESVESLIIGGITSQALKYAFTRSRPSQRPDPNLWFQGKGHYSFPSGEVTATASAVSPFVFQYGPEHPSVYLLELVPIYDAIARVKSQAHWQTDVLAGFALGTGIGYYTYARSSPFLLSVMPHGVYVGLRHQW